MNQEHDSVLIEIWYHQHAEFLFRYACQFIDYHFAQEIVQETFRIVCEMENLEQIEYPKTWLRKITSNVIKNCLREHKKWETLLVDAEKLPEGAFGQIEDETNIELEYAGIIKAGDLRLLKLLTSGYTYADVAKEMNSTAEACRKRAKRASELLRKKIEEYNG